MVGPMNTDNSCRSRFKVAFEKGAAIAGHP